MLLAQTHKFFLIVEFTKQGRFTKPEIDDRLFAENTCHVMANCIKFQTI